MSTPNTFIFVTTFSSLVLNSSIFVLLPILLIFSQRRCHARLSLLFAIVWAWALCDRIDEWAGMSQSYNTLVTTKVESVKRLRCLWGTKTCMYTASRGRLVSCHLYYVVMYPKDSVNRRSQNVKRSGERGKPRNHLRNGGSAFGVWKCRNRNQSGRDYYQEVMPESQKGHFFFLLFQPIVKLKCRAPTIHFV